MEPKIFGIGLSKTGTTSLGHALERLGFEVNHFPVKMIERSRPLWFKVLAKPLNAYAGKKHHEFMGIRPALYRLTHNKPDFSYLSHYEATMDLPIGLYFRELDQYFPKSKFILTIRDEDEWIESARKHFHPNRRIQSYHERNRMRLDVYGTILFEEDKFRRAYRAHNKAVKDYFAGRTKDLMIMDIAQGDGWSELCSFVNRSVPGDTPFPHSNKATERKAPAVAVG